MGIQFQVSSITQTEVGVGVMKEPYHKVNFLKVILITSNFYENERLGILLRETAKKLIFYISCDSSSKFYKQPLVFKCVSLLPGFQNMS